SVKADIARQEGKPPRETTLAELVRDRDWLFQDNSYHLDTTHLASTVRIARALSEPAELRLAIDLTEYGRRLSSQYQYPGEEPFADAQPAQALFFRAQVGEQVEEALTYFRDKAESLPAEQNGAGPAEVYIALLSRLGRTTEA